MYGQIRLLYIIGLSILIQLILQLLKGLLFGFSISLESHSCWQYLRIKSFLGLIQRLLVHEIEKGHTMLIGCYLKVGLLNQIYNYDENTQRHDEFDANISERQEQDYTVLSFLFDSG